MKKTINYLIIIILLSVNINLVGQEINLSVLNIENTLLSIKKIDEALIIPTQETQKDTLETINNWKSAVLWGLTFGIIIYSITEYQDGINGDNGIRDESPPPLF